MNDGISFIVPVHDDGASTICDTLTAIAAEIDGDPSTEIIVVDDTSGEGSAGILAQLAETLPIRVVAGRGRGVAAALNTGIRAAQFSLIAHVDQDVVIHRGWTEALTAVLRDPAVAAAQGWFVRDRSSALWTRARDIDLEQRYFSVADGDTDYVCAGNTIYRAAVLHWIGLFDESLANGYDNDVSYRLQEAGYRLRVERGARSERRRCGDLASYLRQQYRVGYGRIGVVQKHPWRVNGDRVSPAVMMWHPVLMAIAIMMLPASAVCAVIGVSWQPYLAFAGTLIGLLFLERVAASGRALSRFGDAASLTFPVLHLARDLVWVASIGVWTTHCIAGHATLSSRSVDSPAGS